MDIPIQAPPPVLDNARVIEYSVLRESVGYSGRSLLFVDGKDVGPVPCLAICEGTDPSDILLFHCNREWSVLGVSAHKSVAEAKQRGERIYPGLSTRWVETNVSAEQAERYREEMFGNHRCAFCGRRADQVTQMIKKNNTLICDGCVRKFHKGISETSSEE